MLLLEDYCIELGYKKMCLDTTAGTAGLYLMLGYSFTKTKPTLVGSGVR